MRSDLSSTDEDLVRAAVAGAARDAALGEVGRRHWERAYRIARAVTRDAAGAEDAAQETFLKLSAGAGGFEPERGFLPWFHRIALNTAKNQGRSRARRV